MPLLRRARPTAPDESDFDEDPALEEVDDRPAGGPRTAGKGRPTPKRRDAQKPRASLPQPRSRREASKLNREQRRLEAAEQRQALRSGDTRRMPPRDRGPERALARDIVDARRSVSSWALPAFFVCVVLVLFVPSLSAVGTVLELVVLLVVAVDVLILTREVDRRVRERFPDTRVRVKGYVAQRAISPRRFRMPRPRVDIGDRP